MGATRIRSAVLALAAVGALLAGCGGGDDNRDPREILDAALSEANQPRSAVLNITGDVTAEGEEGGNFTVTLNGPFEVGDDGMLSRANLDAELSGEAPGMGGGLTLNAGLAFADDKAYVTWQDQAYELDEGSARELAPDAPSLDEADQLTEEDRQRILDALDNLQNEGTEEIDGVETTHISAEVDLAEELRKAAEEEPELDLNPDDLEKQVDLDPLALDFYVDENDILRRVEVSLSARPGKEADAQGVDSVSATFTMSISEVNEEQTIEVPKKAKPFEQLFQNLGFGALGGLSFGGDDEGGESAIGAAANGQELDAAVEQAEQQANEAVTQAKKQAQKAMAKNAELAKCMRDAAGDPEALQKCLE